ncbi:MAG TPA: signal peptidase I [Candidatus Saccharimonadales bacterium]|nr:signal peptidase I [Candidatus Saccharimonadales bacterium]
MTEQLENPGDIPQQAGTPRPERVQTKPSRREGAKNVASTIAVLLLAPIFAILLTAFVFQSYQVDGPSMQSTLFNNDRLIVWKAPRTWARLTKHAYIPKRGDIIVFTDPNLAQFGQDPNKQLIKRVIGLPGERVVVANNVVTIYNTGHPQGFNPDFTLPYQRLGHDTAGNIDLTVPKDHVFVMGDNRPDSLDSRMFGPVPADHIVGKLIIRVLPVNEMRRF